MTYNIDINGPLPAIQASFMQQYDGTIENILSFSRLPQLLNVSFSYHYCVAGVMHNGDVLTTRDTDGYCEPWGAQTPDMEQNAYALSKAIKNILKTLPLHQNMGTYTLPIVEGKTFGNKHKIFVEISGNLIRIPGLSTSNLNS